MVIVVEVVCFILEELCGVFIVSLATAAKERDNLLSGEGSDPGNGEVRKNSEP